MKLTTGIDRAHRSLTVTSISIARIDCRTNVSWKYSNRIQRYFTCHNGAFDHELRLRYMESILKKCSLYITVYHFGTWPSISIVFTHVRLAILRSKYSGIAQADRNWRGCNE